MSRTDSSIYLQSNITEWLNGKHELPFNKPRRKVERKCRSCDKKADCQPYQIRKSRPLLRINGCTQWEDVND